MLEVVALPPPADECLTDSMPTGHCSADPKPREWYITPTVWTTVMSANLGAKGIGIWIFFLRSASGKGAGRFGGLGA